MYVVEIMPPSPIQQVWRMLAQESLYDQQTGDTSSAAAATKGFFVKKLSCQRGALIVQPYDSRRFFFQMMEDLPGY